MQNNEKSFCNREEVNDIDEEFNKRRTVALNGDRPIQM